MAHLSTEPKTVWFRNIVWRQGLRALRAPLLGALLLAVLSGALGAAPEEQVNLTPRVYLPLQLHEWSSLPQPPSIYGVSDGKPFTLAKSSQGMNLATTAGVTWNRTSISWVAIEPVNTTPDQFKWGTADAKLLPLLKAGIEPIVLILDNPPWAASTPCGPLYDPNDMAELVGALAARYPTIKYWALYNEVDLTTYSHSGVHNGGCFGEPDINANLVPDYGEYAELMRLSWKALHAANPNAELVFGLLAYDNFDPRDSPPGYPGGCCFAYTFLDKLLGYMRDHPLDPGDKYGDVLGFNDYELYNGAYWEHHNPGDTISAKVNALRAKMQAFGVNFPLLASEVSSFPTVPTVGGISYERQASDLARMFTQAAASHLLTSIWWTFVDFPNGCDDPALAAARPNISRIVASLGESANGAPVPNETTPQAPSCAGWTFGIMNQHLKPKLAYFAFKTVAEQLRGWEAVGTKAKGDLRIVNFRQGDQVKRVYYTKSGQTRTVQVKAKQARVVDLYGKVTLLNQAGSAAVSFAVGRDPVFVEILSK